MLQFISGVPCHYHSTNNTYSSSSSYSYHKDKRAKLGDILAKRSSLGTKIFLSSKCSYV
jgi:hypothetical protein